MDSTSYGLAFEYPLKKIDFVGEIVGENSELQNWLLGIRYKFKQTTHINCAYSNNFNDSGNKFILGFNYEF